MRSFVLRREMLVVCLKEVALGLNIGLWCEKNRNLRVRVYILCSILSDSNNNMLSRKTILLISRIVDNATLETFIW